MIKEFKLTTTNASALPLQSALDADYSVCRLSETAYVDAVTDPLLVNCPDGRWLLIDPMTATFSVGVAEG